MEPLRAPGVAETPIWACEEPARNRDPPPFASALIGQKLPPGERIFQILRHHFSCNKINSGKGLRGLALHRVRGVSCPGAPTKIPGAPSAKNTTLGVHEKSEILESVGL